MKKENFVTMILSLVGGVLFGLGMCMCLQPEWNAFNQGIVMGLSGIIALLIMVIVRRKMQGKPAIKFNAKLTGITLFVVFGALLLGIGMCLTMVWSGLLMQGIFVGLIGIVLLVCAFPLYKGIY